MNEKQRICPICGTEFTPRTYNHKYCSKECSKVARVEHIKQWRKDNRERYQRSSREYSKKHPRIYRESARRYYQNHKEERRAYNRKYYQERKVKNKENARIYQCRLKHNNCFNCPTENGDCLYE